MRCHWGTPRWAGPSDAAANVQAALYGKTAPGKTAAPGRSLVSRMKLAVLWVCVWQPTQEWMKWGRQLTVLVTKWENLSVQGEIRILEKLYLLPRAWPLFRCFKNFLMRSVVILTNVITDIQDLSSFYNGMHICSLTHLIPVPLSQTSKCLFDGGNQTIPSI